MMHNQVKPATRIVSFMAFETGTYNQVFDRPYQTNITPNDVNRYSELTQDGRLINNATLSTLAPNILMPAAVAGAPIQIPHGWNQTRYRFVLVVEQTMGIGGILMHIFTGYTDHNEATGLNQSTINPNINLYFNTCVTVNVAQNLATSTHQATAQGRVTEQYHMLLRPQDVNPIRGYNMDGPVSLRPKDVIDKMSENESSLNGTTTSLCNGLMSESIIRSSRSYNAAPSYLAETLQAINYSTKAYDQGNVQPGTGMYDAAIGLVDEMPIRQDAFLQSLITRTNLNRDGCVTWGMLKSLYPYIENPQVTHFKRIDPNRKDVYIHRAGGTEHWSGSTQETAIAARIAAAVPSAMIASLVGVAVFHVSNMGNRGIEVAVTHAAPLVRVVAIDLLSAVEQLKKQLVIDIFNAVTDNNRIPIECNIRCDVMGDIFISVQFNCQPKIDFTLPTFADHLFTPIISRTRANLDRIAQDMSALAGVTAVRNAVISTNPSTGGILPLSQVNTAGQAPANIPGVGINTGYGI